jgi:FKBP-type peptidyl-prolyl cis-trans isomerase 2
MAPDTGQTVRVHYKGTLKSGEQFDSSEGRDPLEFTVGTGDVIPGFDVAVANLQPGESTTVTIPAVEAYGEHMSEAVQPVPLSAFPETPETGWAIELTGPEGEHIPAIVAGVEGDQVFLDFNHPLAGEDLTFDITLVELVPEQ